MGGRGGSSGLGAGNAKSNKGNPFNIPELSANDIKSLGRKQLETIATAIYANNAMKSGLSREEGIRRARSLMDGNTTAQLRKYIKKNNKR